MNALKANKVLLTLLLAATLAGGCGAAAAENADIASVPDASAAQASEANRGVPVFMAHGDADDIVVLARGEAARDALAALGYPVHWHSYPMGHEVCMDEIADLNAWLEGRLSNPA